MRERRIVGLTIRTSDGVEYGFFIPDTDNPSIVFSREGEISVSSSDPEPTEPGSSYPWGAVAPSTLNRVDVEVNLSWNPESLQPFIVIRKPSTVDDSSTHDSSTHTHLHAREDDEDRQREEVSIRLLIEQTYTLSKLNGYNFGLAMGRLRATMQGFRTGMSQATRRYATAPQEPQEPLNDQCAICEGTGLEPTGDGSRDVLCSICGGSGVTGVVMGPNGQPVPVVTPTDDPDEKAPW